MDHTTPSPPFLRPNLHLSVRRPPYKLPALFSLLKARPESSGLVICASDLAAEDVCGILNMAGFSAAVCHRSLPEHLRRTDLERFLQNRKKILVTTGDAAMEIGKNDLSFVIHYNMPASLESYCREACLAGLDGRPADCILIYHPADIRAFRLEHPSSVKDTQRAYEDLRQMALYCTTTSCLHSFLTEYYGQFPSAPCGTCSNCRKPSAPARKRSGKPSRRKNDPRFGLPEDRIAIDHVLLADLRALRAEIAHTKKLPVTIIFSDADLERLCRECPQSDAELHRIFGIGHVNAARYGEAFLAVLRGRRQLKPGQTTTRESWDLWQAQKPWTVKERARLRAEADAGHSLARIAELHARTVPEVREQLEAEGYLEQVSRSDTDHDIFVR